MQSLLALRGGNIQRDIHDEFGPDANIEEWYQQTEVALSRTVEFLRSQGVPHLSLVPSTFPIPVVAAFFHLHPDPDPWNERLLGLWTWRGWVHGFGTGGQTPVLRKAVQAVNPVKGSRDKAPSEYDAVKTLLQAVPDEAAGVVVGSPFRTDTASGRLCLLALASRRPRSLDGKEITLVDVLEQTGVDAVTELIPGNRGDVAARGFWPRGKKPTGHENQEVLESHAIGLDAAAALRENDRDRFLRARRETIKDLATAFLASKIQVGLTVRPPLEDLFVQDDENGD